MILKGRVWYMGDDVDTDMIISGQYLSTIEPQFLATHCFEAVEPNWADKVSTGDIIVAGKNFACGSSREQAPIALKAVGISCLIAESFGAIFFRNAVNIGLPVLELDDTGSKFKEGETAEVDIEAAAVRNVSSGVTYELKPTVPIVMEILEAGGLLSFIKKKI